MTKGDFSFASLFLGIDDHTGQPKGVARQLFGDTSLARGVDEFVLAAAHAAPAIVPVATGIILSSLGLNINALSTLAESVSAGVAVSSSLYMVETTRNTHADARREVHGMALAKQILDTAREKGVMLTKKDEEAILEAAPSLESGMRTLLKGLEEEKTKVRN